MEAAAPLEQRAEGQSEDAPILRLHCADKPRPEGNHIQFKQISKGGAGANYIETKSLEKHSYRNYY